MITESKLYKCEKCGAPLGDIHMCRCTVYMEHGWTRAYVIVDSRADKLPLPTPFTQAEYDKWK